MRLSPSARRAFWIGAVVSVCSCTSLTAPDWTLIDSAAGSGGSTETGGSFGVNAGEGGRVGMAAVNEAGEAGALTGGAAGSPGESSAAGEAGEAGAAQL